MNSFRVASSSFVVARRALFKNALSRHFSTGKQFLVINAVGVDRPGIVSDITKIVTNSNGNVGDSRAVKLGHHFSLMMLVSVPQTEHEGLKDSFKVLEDLHVATFDTTDPGQIEIQPKIAYTGRLKLSGADNPGIVHKVTSLLAQHSLSIDSLHTEEQPAPFGGTTLFVMDGVVTAAHPTAEQFSIKKVQEELNDLGNSMNCDISMDNVADENDQACFSSM